MQLRFELNILSVVHKAIEKESPSTQQFKGPIRKVIVDLNTMLAHNIFDLDFHPRD